VEAVGRRCSANDRRRRREKRRDSFPGGSVKDECGVKLLGKEK